MRRTIFMGSVMALLALLLVSGCSRQRSSTSSGSGSGSSARSGVRAAVVTDVGGIGDMSFNAMAWEGLKRAGRELGIKASYIESTEQADYVTNLRKLAQQGYDLVFAVGFMMEDAVAQVAKEYPKTKFAIIDGKAPSLPNATALKYREEEGCFLAGALAASVSKTGKIGFVGGMNVPLINRFECGYTAGARTMKPTAQVLAAYTGSFADPGKGKELALTQFSQGAQVVFHASGSCGLGVIDAAKSKGTGFYAIGVDADQDYLAPGRVLTSMMKRVDVTVYDVCRSVVDGHFKAGDQVFGIKEGGIGLSPMKYTKKDVPSETLARVDRLREMIASGKLTPPKTAAELKRFIPPAVE